MKTSVKLELSDSTSWSLLIRLCLLCLHLNSIPYISNLILEQRIKGSYNHIGYLSYFHWNATFFGVDSDGFEEGVYQTSVPLKLCSPSATSVVLGWFRLDLDCQSFGHWDTVCLIVRVLVALVLKCIHKYTRVLLRVWLDICEWGRCVYNSSPGSSNAFSVGQISGSIPFSNNFFYFF